MTKHPHKVYHRYHIDTRKSPNIAPHPSRFLVEVNKIGLAKLLCKELVHYRGNLDVVLSRPCVYGVFSGPLGGFFPRNDLCVGCLRCTTQYPEMVKVLHNPEHNFLGDAYFKSDSVATVMYEAETGRIPIRGQGYRGKFGGTGWDGMWTDMSEIVRPTRDGIHGREYISTEVDLGSKPIYLELDEDEQPSGSVPKTISIPLPMIFDVPPKSNQSNKKLCEIQCEAAKHILSFTILPFQSLANFTLQEAHVIPLIQPCEYEAFIKCGFKPQMIELSEWNEKAFRNLGDQFPDTLVILRTEYDSDLMKYYHAGVRIFHLTANYHGMNKEGKFVLDLIREAHLKFVKACCRDQVTLVGSGGIILAEHVPKAIICGLDAVAIDTSILYALQAKGLNNTSNPEEAKFLLPKEITVDWGTQRLKNLAASWRDQLLEILGAMGIREVRRLRGEMGRAIFQKDLEKEAFGGIAGYHGR
jgi:hypothetical protein